MDLRPKFPVNYFESKIKGTLFEALSLEIIIVEDGYVEIRMPVRPKHLAPNGYLHAGSIVALADSTCGIGAFAHLPSGANSFTTIELKTNFLSTIVKGELRCGAKPKHLGRSTQVWDAEVSNAETGKAIAIFRCTQMVLWPSD